LEDVMAANSESDRLRDKPVPVAGIVDRLIGSLGLAQRYYGWLIVSQWPELVGEYYADRSRAFRFDNGELYVAVEDPAWRQQMAMDTEKILEIIHARPHGRVIKKLRLVRGEKGTRINGDQGQDN
jgi:hypothetical protein